ncbi:MAG TPA: VOC family protein [Burkholderiaceae bacterium]|jgi:predicted 3-demethylubiquinone-9 3-methyltransferase (glyoxalase superfamily)
MQNIYPCLWFDDQAEEAANFYVSIFKNAKILDTTHYLEGAPKPAGSVMTVEFILDGQQFLALNGGPQFKFSPAISMVAKCETQADIDYLWEKLLVGGQEVQCGWLTDKFGVSWQVVPNAIPKLFSGNDEAAKQRAFAAMMKMKKLDIAMLEHAYKNS